jgi:imidazolonepropionase-like amidohydrolase
MAEKNAFLVPTLVTYRALAEEGIAAGLPAAWAPKIAEVSHAGLNALRLAHQAGIRIVYGTDLLGAMQRRQLEEFAIRAEVQAPIDIIRSATVTAAALFRLSNEIGTVAPGKRADLLVIEGDPLADIATLQNPDKYLKAIIRDGRPVKLDPALVPAGSFKPGEDRPIKRALLRPFDGRTE